MNRRGFISLLTGAAGAVLVPWRGLSAPLILLPPPPRVDLSHYFKGPYWFPPDPFSNRLSASSVLYENAVEELLTSLDKSMRASLGLMPPQLIVSPRVKQLIDTDPVVRRAAEITLGRKL